jgi:hypothetical protein
MNRFSVDAIKSRAVHRWPEQCDVRACQRYLHSAFEHARAMPGFDNLFGPRFTAEQAVQPMDIFKR